MGTSPVMLTVRRGSPHPEDVRITLTAGTCPWNREISFVPGRASEGARRHGWLPLVLPFVGLAWLWHTRPGGAQTRPKTWVQ